MFLDNNEEEITFKEVIKLKDKGYNSNKGRGLSGHITIYQDAFDKKILEKDNLIVLRGRAYALELLFKDPIPSSSGYLNDLTRKICMFKIGSGGADIQSSPFQPFVPLYSDMDLSNPVPFVIEDSTKNDTDDKKNNTSIIEQMTAAQKKKYYGGVSRSDGSTAYYNKVFDNEPLWVVNKDTNEVYKKILININTNEARGYFINELGLTIAAYDETNNIMNNIELFSRVTFNTRPLNTSTSSFIATYLIFA